MRYGSRLIAAMALAIALSVSIPNAALGAYAYHYGFTWDSPSGYSQYFWDNNFYPSSDLARGYTSSRYTSKAIGSDWSSSIYNNLSTLSVLSIDTHGTTGFLVCQSDDTQSSNGNLYNMSCLRGDTSHVPRFANGTVYHAYQTGRDLDLNGEEDLAWQYCHHYRFVQNISGTPLRIAVVKACNSALPPYEGVSTRLAAEGADCVVGFSDAIYGPWRGARSAPSDGTIGPGYTWSNWFWNYMYNSYYAGYSADVAAAKVRDIHGGGYEYFGYDQHVILGNPNTKL